MRKLSGRKLEALVLKIEEFCTFKYLLVHFSTHTTARCRQEFPFG